MSAPPITVSPETPIYRAARLMAQNGCGFLPVVENDQPVGVITDRDILVRVTAHGLSPEATPVRSVMTRPVYGINADCELGDAIATMQDRHVRRLIAVDGVGKLIGILSLDDLVGQVPDNHISATVVQLISTYGPDTTVSAAEIGACVYIGCR